MTDAVIMCNLRPNQLEHHAALRAAHQLGLDVLLITDQKADVAPSLLAEQIRVPTYDIAQLVEAGRELARRHRVAGVVTWSDRDVLGTAELARALDLPGLSPEAAPAFRNKHRMRSALSALPEYLPRYARVTSLDELERAAEHVGTPAVLKPTGAAGSIGIFEIHSPADLRPAFDQLHAYTRPEVHPIFATSTGELILEEFLTGSEHSVEGYAHQGRVTVAGITDKTTLAPFHTETRHVFPSALPEEARAAITRMTEAVVTELGLADGVFHLECKWDGERARLIEIAARVGGDHITSHLVPLATGRSFYENTLRIATGQAPLAPTRPELAAGVQKFLAPHAGTFQGFEGLAEATTVPGLEHLVVDTRPGATVRVPPEHYMEYALGAALVRAGTPAEVTATLDTLQSLVRPVVTA
ncbi:ATP-grasp domain-containing protein [Streptomyces gulbargensis]|uniref:ATP-grasp domain-containing protein n=1 Tax=Streptomyces gulbargensis TaxID=364901 RepID=A0ABP7N365_9ACTN